MISALLLSLALTGARADSVAAPAIAASDDPPIQLWINNDRRFLPGDRAKVQVRTREDGYLLVVHVDPDGHLRMLFPLDPRDDDFVRGGRKYEIRGRGGRESFTVDNRPGRGTVYAAVSRDPYRFDGFTLDDHWDYRALAPTRLSGDPEAELNELVRRLAQGDFDYDILTYDVLDRAAYADYYSTPYYGPAYSCFSCGYRPYHSRFNISVGLFFGRPFHRAYYDPFYPFYDPFYSPFFYDPYYYPVAYWPVYYPRHYYPYPLYRSPHYVGVYNSPRYRQWDGNTPYRFRPTDGVQAGYRARGFAGGRAINTVYLPPRTRVIQPGSSSPARRVEVQPREIVQPGGSRTAPDARRVESRPVAKERAPTPEAEGGTVQRRQAEARRAREPEGRRDAAPAVRSRQESWPQDVSPRREMTPRDASPGEASPREVTPRRSEVDRPEPQIERAPAPRESAPEARSARREEAPQSSPPPREGSGGWSDDRGSDRGGDRGGSGGRSEAPTARSWGGGSGGGGGGGGQAPMGGGGRRR
jgi:uncharacterized membrane protein YgcG